MVFLAGQVPLAPAFWRFAILYGTVVNLFATVASLAAHVAGLPDAVGLALFLLPVPYSIIAVYGVWRCSAHYAGPEHWVTAAKCAVLLWATIMIFV